MTSLAAEMTAGSGTKDLTFTDLTKKLYPFAADISAHTERDMTVFDAEVPGIEPRRVLSIVSRRSPRPADGRGVVPLV